MPDVFIPADTTDVTKYFVEVAGRNILYRYTIEYADRHREALNAVKTIDELQALLDSDKTLVDDFVRDPPGRAVLPRTAHLAVVEADRGQLPGLYRPQYGVGGQWFLRKHLSRGQRRRTRHRDLKGGE